MREFKYNIIVVFLEKGIQLFGSLFLVSILSRSLGIEVFGEWQLLLSYLAIFSAFSIFCASEVVVPRYVKNKKSIILDYIISNVFWARFLSTILLYIILLVLSGVQFSFSNTFLILSFSVVINESISSFGAYLTAQKKAYFLSISRLIAFFIKVILVYVFIGVLHYPLIYLAFIWIVEAVISSSLIIVFYIRNKSIYIYKPNYKYIGLLLRRSVIFGIGLGFFILFRKLDKILFSYNFSDYQLGIYTASSQLTEVVYQLIIVISSVIAPIVIYDKKNINIIIRNRRIIILLYLLLSITILFVLYKFLPTLYVHIFSEKYIDGVKYFITVMWVFPLFLIDNLFVLYLVQYKNVRFFLVKWGCTCIIYIPLFYITVHFYNDIGASISIVLSLFVSFFITIYYLKNKIITC